MAPPPPSFNRPVHSAVPLDCSFITCGTTACSPIAVTARCAPGDPSQAFVDENEGSIDATIVDLVLIVLLGVFSVAALWRFLIRSNSGQRRCLNVHTLFHFAHVVFCAVRMIMDTLLIAALILLRKEITGGTNAGAQTFNSMIVAYKAFFLLSTIAQNTMWLLLMSHWYSVSFPLKAHLTRFHRAVCAFNVLFAVALVITAILDTSLTYWLFDCVFLAQNLIMCINSVVLILFTAFVGINVSSKLKGLTTATAALQVEGMFVFSCAVQLARAVVYFVITSGAFPAICRIGGKGSFVSRFWMEILSKTLPLVPSFLFLCLMWRSAVADLRTDSEAIEDDVVQTEPEEQAAVEQAVSMQLPTLRA